MAVLGPHSLKLPRLFVRDELVKARPELGELLAQQERRFGTGFSNKPKSAQITLNTTAGRALLAGSLMEEEVSPEELMRREMEAVKLERHQLLQQLTAAKTNPGKASGDLQTEDIQHMRHEIEVKRSKLNELHEELLLAESEAQHLILTNQDCSLLMPDGSPEAKARLSELQEEHKALDVDLSEAEAKHRLYTLLEARTKLELQEMANRVAEAQQLQGAYEADKAALLVHVHALKAALEDAAKEKRRVAVHYEGTREDWAQKLRDRHKEARELQRRQQEDSAREERRLKNLADKAAAERERAAQLRMQEEAYGMQLQAILPKLEAMEEAWGKLHTITGAETPDALIAHWKGLKVQEESMHELARLAEARQAEAREHVQSLLAERSRLLEEASNDDDDPQQGASKPVAEGERSAAGGQGSDEKIRQAASRSATAKKQFGRLRDVCIGAQQGLHAMNARLEAALPRLETLRPAPPAEPGRPRRTASLQRLPREGSSVRIAAVPLGPRLQRLYTITQDEFFPDLLLLLKCAMEKVVTLVGCVKQLPSEASSAAENDSLASLPERENSPPGKLPRGSSMRRRTWTGPPWMPKAHQSGGPLREASLDQKRGVEARPDLSRLVGFIEDAPPPTHEPAKDEGKPEELHGTVNRHIIKNRTAKIMLRHRAATALKVAAKK